MASVLIAALAALVVTVITLVNRIELQATSIRESVKVLGREVAGVWSSAVGVFVHTVTAAPQLDGATQRLRELRP